MAKLPNRRKREKAPGSGRDFRKGQNSHTGEVFKRGADMLPRGNMTLFYKVLYHDEREALYQRHCRVIRYGSNRDVLELSKIMGDRIEGRPGHVDRPARPTSWRSRYVRCDKKRD
jgi:hypothetical protein